MLGLPAAEIIKNYEEDELLKSDDGSDDEYEDFKMKSMRLSLRELSLKKKSSPVKQLTVPREMARSKEAMQWIYKLKVRDDKLIEQN